MYVRGDGVYLNVSLTGERACVLVLIGAKEHGTEETLSVHDGMRPSEQPCLEVIEPLKTQGI